MASIDDLIDIRKTKIAEMIGKKINPFPSTTERNKTAKEVIDNFSMTSDEKVTVAGRIMSIRPHGKITFIHIQDETSQIQLFFSEATLNESYEDIKNYLDIGDFIQGTGEIFKTKSGEITIKIETFKILTKAIRPIPSEFYGIKDEEEILRKRYLELILSPETRDLFVKRAKFISEFRNYLNSKGFLEVETPTLELVTGGAEANPFVTHHDSLDTDLYLRISLELHLKRLIVGGYEKIFEIGRVFRNEGMSRQHLQEFTMLEFYWAYANYEMLMDLIEDLYTTVIQNTFGTLEIEYEGEILNFKAPWKRIDYNEILLSKGIDLNNLKTTAEIRQKGLEIGLPDEPNAQRNRWIDRIYKKLVRAELIQPCFLINHPVDISPLAKRSYNNSQLTERFQVLVAGAELGNGFSELNDPIDQRERFEYQQKLRDAGDKEAEMMDQDFVEALEYGMPPTAGFGIGLDRIFSILTNSKSIRNVVFFPTVANNK